MDTVPLDLVGYILEFLLSFENRKTSFALRLVCRRFDVAFSRLFVPLFRISSLSTLNRAPLRYRHTISNKAELVVDFDKRQQQPVTCLPVAHLDVRDNSRSWMDEDVDYNTALALFLKHGLSMMLGKLRRLRIHSGRKTVFSCPHILHVLSKAQHLTHITATSRPLVDQTQFLDALSNLPNLSNLVMDEYCNYQAFENLHKLRALKLCDIKVDVGDSEIDDDDLGVLGRLFVGMTRLSSLSLTVRGSPRKLDGLMKTLPNLQRFVFVGPLCDIPFTVALEGVEGMRSLTYLSLENTGQQIFSWPQVFFSLPRLVTLVLKGRVLLGGFSIPNSDPVKCLKSLEFGGFETRLFSDIDLWNATNLLALEKLHIREMPSSSHMREWKELEGLSRLRCLKKLIIGSNLGLGKRGASVIATLQNLKRLKIENMNEIGDNGARYLSMLTQLEKLEIESGNLLSCTGFQHLTRISTLKTLRVESVCVSLESRMRPWFSCITRLTKLQVLSIEDILIDKHGFRSLAKLPFLRVLFIGKSTGIALDPTELYDFLARPDDTHCLEYVAIAAKGNGLENCHVREKCRVLVSTADRRLELDIEV